MNEIPNILEPKEKVEWEGKPSYLPYMISISMVIIIISALVLLFSWGKANLTVIILITIAISALLFLFTHLSYRVAHYAITNKRVIIQYGIIGRDFKTFDYDKIQNASVNVGLLGIIFKVGNIQFFTGEISTTSKGRPIAVYDTFYYIDAPYDILKKAQTHLSTRKEKLYGGKG